MKKLYCPFPPRSALSDLDLCHTTYADCGEDSCHEYAPTFYLARLMVGCLAEDGEPQLPRRPSQRYPCCRSQRPRSCRCECRRSRPCLSDRQMLGRKSGIL